VLHGGRIIKVSVSERSKKKGGRVGTSLAPKVSPAVPLTDLKVNNLPYSVDEITLRGVFKDFGVSKVIVKTGYAFVGVASS
jgi:RNA recognition motif-containing protein